MWQINGLNYLHYALWDTRRTDGRWSQRVLDVRLRTRRHNVSLLQGRRGEGCMESSTLTASWQTLGEDYVRQWMSFG